MKLTLKKLFSPRIVLSLTLTVCLAVCAFFGGFTSSRYYKEFPKDEHTFLSQNFFFTSDKMVEGGKTITEYDWDFSNNYTINIYNYIFETQANTTLYSAISSTVTISVSGSGTLQSGSSVTLTGGQKSSSIITVHPTNAAGSTFTVTATTAPYVKTISATFTLSPKSESSDIVVSVQDSGSGYSTAKLKIKIAPHADTNKQLYFYFYWTTSKLIPDMTDYLLTNTAHSPTADGANGYRLTLKYGGSYEITLLKASTTTSYNKASITASTSSADSTTGIRWYTVAI